MSTDAAASGKEPPSESIQEQYLNAESNTDGGVVADEEGVDSLHLNSIFDILKNQRRRRVIQYLNGRDGPVAIGDLSEHIAALENDTTASALTSQERKRVYVGLYQSHLPKMDDAGVVAFNKPRGVVRLGPNASQLRPYLDHTQPRRDTWARYYLMLASVGGLVVLSHPIIDMLVGVTLPMLFTVIIVGFLALAVIHVSVERREQSQSTPSTAIER